MTTSEFIKMLQDADPGGQAHIRMSGGVPKYAELKPGYYDGSYTYIDENGNWVSSTKGDKVDIWTTDMSDFVYDLVDTYAIPTWEDIEKKFIFEMTAYSNNNQRSEREQGILDRARKYYDEAVTMHKKFEDEGLVRAIEQAGNGWKWFQNKLVDDKSIEFNEHHFYTWKVYDENGKVQSSNPHNVEAVVKSGMFEKLDNSELEGYYEWKFAPRFTNAQ